MNILYLTLDDFDSLINYRSINTDLLREFQKNGHAVHVISPSEKRKGLPSRVINENGAIILKPVIGNIQKTNLIEKGISTLTIGHKLIKTIKNELSDVKIDLILYCTPPITFLSVIEYVKTRDGARTYLLLKDIFPQNAVDLGMMTTTGIKGVLYRHFRRQEKKLYKVSDRIGCMSPANVEYVIRHNPEVDPDIVEVCPNAIDVIDKSVDSDTKEKIRDKYGIPQDKTVFVYGGNLGKPQGIPFLIECLRACETLDNIFFLIVGDGTEYHLIQDYVNSNKPQNVKLLKRLPKEDYDNMVGACDVGMIFLDHRFTIPNFPSRILSYMSAKLPVLACTDVNTDIGKVIVDGHFGWWCESSSSGDLFDTICRIENEDFSQLSENGFELLKNRYSVEIAYEIIVKRENNEKIPEMY